MSTPYHLDYADLIWQPDGTPRSRQFDDIYFSGRQGLAESRAVFLEPNLLAQRWRQLPFDGQFVIGETGFGSGLNFLACWQLWREVAPQGARLHFISVEKHPLRLTDLRRALALWPELADLNAQLLAHYPVLIPGHHCLSLGSVTLHLLLGDAVHCLTELLGDTAPTQVDSWFLDGFAPSKNPLMWRDDLLQRIGQLSHDGTRFATFSVAGKLRRGLQQAGFVVSKRPGFSNKREMLCGYYTARTKQPQAILSADKHVAIIGGGLAGVQCAYALARRGHRVTLIERHQRLAQEASGNAQAVLYTRLITKTSPLIQFNLSSYLYALRHYQQLAKQHILQAGHYDFCGVLAWDPRKPDQHAQLQQTFGDQPRLVQFVNAQQASAIAGIHIDHCGGYFPHAGWISPVHLCQQLTAQPAIELRLHTEVMTLNYQHGRWYITIDGQPLSFDSVVIANSFDALRFSQTAHLPLQTLRGQVTQLPANSDSQTLRTVVCHHGYIIPATDQRHWIGATFHHSRKHEDPPDYHRQPTLADHRQNIALLSAALPGCFANSGATVDPTMLAGRVGWRCKTHDYLPVVGPVPSQPGLYINVAHGSRGLTATPLCAELIAALICGEPLPVAQSLYRAVRPDRFTQ